MIPVWLFPWLLFLGLIPFEGPLNTLGLGLPLTLLGVGAAFLLALFVRKEGWTIRFRTLMVALLLLAMNLSFWFAPDMDMSRHTLVPVNAIALIYFLMSTVALSRQELEWSLVAWMRGGGVLAGLIVFSYCTGRFLEEGRATFLFDPNYLAAELLLPFAIALWLLRKRKETWLWVPLMLSAIWLTQSRGGLLSVGVLILVSLAQSGQWRRLFLVAGLSAALFVWVQPSLGERFDFSQDNTGSGRTEIWKVAYHEGMDHWLTGVGVGTFPLVCSTDCHFFAPLNVHNTYLQAFVEAGGLGLLGLFFALLTHLPRSRAPAGGAIQAGLLGIVAAAFFLDFLYYRLFWITLGIASQVLLDRRNS